MIGFGLGTCNCCGECTGCTCAEETQIQVTAETWENGFCEECEDLNTAIILPRLESFTGDAFTLCFGSGCDSGCYPGGGHQCFFGIEAGENPCTQIGLTPARPDASYCDEENPCDPEFQPCGAFDSVYDVFLDSPHTPYYRGGCVPHCDYDPHCGTDPETLEPRCLGGNGGYVTDCDPMVYDMRCMVWQSHDRVKTVVAVQIVLHEYIGIWGSGCATYDGPCDELDIDVPITLCSGADSQWRTGDALPRYRPACYIPTSVNVMAI